MLQHGTPAPDFTLNDQDGTPQSLQNFRGSWVLLYFYPKDDTSGCTKEACGLRDVHALFSAKRCVIVGVSADSQKSHQAFREKHRLPFTLLADTERTVIDAYQAWKQKDGDKTEGISRVSYLIDPEGMIAKAYPGVSPEEHAAEVLKDLEGLQGESRRE